MEDKFPVLDGFEQDRITTTGAEINLRRAGEGPPLWCCQLNEGRSQLNV